MSGASFYGFESPFTGQSDVNAISFLVQQVLARIQTLTLVKVISATNAGGVEPAGLLDVQPLVSATDGHGTVVPHGVVHEVLYLRLQGSGGSAIIIDPAPGDIGICGFASRDLSSVKASKAQAAPGSNRRFDMADALYLGGCLNGLPTQLLAFSADGIAITTPKALTINASNLVLDANGNLTTTGDVTGGTGVTLNTHEHPVSTAPGVTGPPEA